MVVVVVRRRWRRTQIRLRFVWRKVVISTVRRESSTSMGTVPSLPVPVPVHRMRRVPVMRMVSTQRRLTQFERWWRHEAMRNRRRQKAMRRRRHEGRKQWHNWRSGLVHVNRGIRGGIYTTVHYSGNIHDTVNCISASFRQCCQLPTQRRRLGP